MYLLELSEEFEDIIIVLVIVDISTTFLCATSERYVSIEHKHLVFLILHKIEICLKPFNLSICES